MHKCTFKYIGHWILIVISALCLSLILFLVYKTNIFSHILYLPVLVIIHSQNEGDKTKSDPLD